MTDGYSTKDFDQAKMLAELLLRITALENLLIAKQIITEEEIGQHFQLLAIKINDIINSVPENELPVFRPVKMLAAAAEPENELDILLKTYNLNTHKISKDN